MKNKVLVNIYVPTIDALYELYIPTNESIRKVLELIVKSVYDLSDNNLNIEVKHFLLDPEEATMYNELSIVRDTNIKNGKKIILV